MQALLKGAAASALWHQRSTPLDAYATHSAATGGPLHMSLASRLRFCAVAVSSTSSLAPFKPRSRSRLSLRACYGGQVAAFAIPRKAEFEAECERQRRERYEVSGKGGSKAATRAPSP